jgi:transcriptional regulator with XRE-family HTH domain
MSKTIYAKNLKKRRIEMRYTQPKISAALGIKVTRYQKWEEGECEPSIEYQVQLCELLMIDDLYLFMKKG